MDRADYVRKLEELAASERKSLQASAVAYVTDLAEGRFEEAEHMLKKAMLSRWRLDVIEGEKGSGLMWDSSYARVLADVEGGDGGGFQKRYGYVKNMLAERAFREFQAAWRLFAVEGEALGPRIMEKLYALDPTEREKKIRGFSPLVSEIKDVDRPCYHNEAPVICEEMTFGRPYPIKVICTECSQRFDAVGANGGALVKFVEEPETDAISAKITQVIRPYVRG